MSILKKAALAGLAAVIALQFVPVDRSNPAVAADLEGPPDAEAALRRMCYDCHSNETRWPWYAWLAPASWLVAHDVAEGREHMNFSNWGLLAPADQRHLAEEALEEVEEGKMPLRVYLLAHPDAAPTSEDLAALRAWVQGLQP